MKNNPGEKPLQSWKEIGAYLQRNEVTARRWEKEEGLPVHRHAHRGRSSVYAYPSEIDAWRASRKVVPNPTPPTPLWRSLLETPRSLVFALTVVLFLITVGAGVHPQVASAQAPAADRAVWAGPHVDMFGRVSPDGRFITYVDWIKTGNLMVHDVMANSDRALTKNASYGQFGESGYSTISRDGKQVAYEWNPKDSDRQDLFVAALDGKGQQNPRRVFHGSDDIRFLNPRDWSPDGKWIVVTIQRKDGTGAIALIAVGEGALRLLKSVGWNIPEQVFFSPDGKYLAYDLPADDTNDQRDIFVLAIDGGREIPAVVNPAQDGLLGWSPDGRMLLFSSDRTGATGLWAQPLEDGKLQGDPELLRADIGSSAYSLGLTGSGSLYIWKEIISRDIKIAPVDLNAGKLTGPPVSFKRGFLPAVKDPSWSPDGKYLAYAAGSGSGQGNFLAIRSVESGEVRRLPRELSYLREPQWSPDGRSLVVSGRDAKGRDGVYRIEVQTGKAAPVAYTESPGLAGWSPDGNRVYYYSRGRAALIEHNLASAVEREIIRGPFLTRNWALSPDGRSVAIEATDPAAKTSSLLLVSVADGERKELLRLAEPEAWIHGVRNVAWAPDGRTVLVVKSVGAQDELWRVPVDGSAARKLDIDPEIWIRGAIGGTDRGFALSPNGQRIAFLTGKSAAETWILESVLPQPAEAKK